jgi:PAS domain S-box-containing protein
VTPGRLGGGRSFASRYGVAVLVVFLAGIVRAGLNPLWGFQVPLITFYPAIMASAWYGGFGPGLTTTLLSSLTAYVLWMRWAVSSAGGLAEIVAMLIFVGIGIFMSAVTEALRRMERRQAVTLSEAEAARAEADTGREAMAQLGAVIQSADDAIIAKTLDGVITSWNAGAERMFGYTAAEATGQSVMLIIPEDRRVEEEEVLARIRRGQSVEHFETVRQAKDGRRLDISVRVSPIRDTSGQLIGASKIARDISERKRMEVERTALLASERQARAEAEAANRAKDEFLALLSHELRTPLNAVYGWARMLQAGQLEASDAPSALDAIVRNANSQVQLIDDLLEVSRVITGKMRLDVRNVDLKAVIEAALDSVRPAAAAKDIRLRSVLDPRAGPIVGDPDRLQQVVWNLLMNAVKFTAKRGQIQVQLQRANSHVEIIVSDTGQGIAPDVLPFIFDRFAQADSSPTRTHSGLGLGLTLVKHLVELHGGTVTAESGGEGQGAMFLVKLPLPVAKLSAGPVPRVHPTAGPLDPSMVGARLDGLRVLVVDDDADALTLALAILQRAGALVTTCASVSEALDLLRQWRPDVLVSDIEMPREDGYSLIRKVRALSSQEGGRVPAVALTAYGRAEDRVRSLSAGYNMHVPKPVDPGELTTIIASISGRTTPAA